jgi:hypothetical protein
MMPAACRPISLRRIDIDQSLMVIMPLTDLKWMIAISPGEGIHRPPF